MPKKQKNHTGRRILNKTARFQYHILETVQAGIALRGSEVKSLRNGAARINEAHARIQNEEVTLIGAHIDAYPPATNRNHVPDRARKLLLHRREIKKLLAKVTERGTTLVPLSIYFNDRGLAKVDLALVRGKSRHDRREDICKREHQREMDRAMARRR